MKQHIYNLPPAGVWAVGGSPICSDNVGVSNQTLQGDEAHQSENTWAAFVPKIHFCQTS